MNIDTPCPQCGTVFTVRRELVGKRTKCIRCGAAFTIAEVAPAPAPAAPPPPPTTAPPPSPPSPPPAIHTAPEITTEAPTIAPPPQITIHPELRTAIRTEPMRERAGIKRTADHSRFPMLALMARCYEILAIVALAFAVVAMLMFVLAVIQKPEAILGILVGSGLTVFWAILVAISLLAFAQAIRLVLQIEQNTRQTQEACRQLADHLGAIETEP